MSFTQQIQKIDTQQSNLNTRKAHFLFKPILFHNFSGYDCHLIFEKIGIEAIEKGFEIKG